jgi:hypothetical protein
MDEKAQTEPTNQPPETPTMSPPQASAPPPSGPAPLLQGGVAPQYSTGIMAWLDSFLGTQGPVQLSEQLRDLAVTLIPFGILLLLLYMLVLLPLFAFGLHTNVTGAGMTLAWISIITRAVLFGLALPGMFTRKLSGWKLTFAGIVAGFAGSLLNFDIIGALVGGLLGSYVLFQIRSRYH